ncbi:MAG: peptidoglycan-associated lipoprotein Pal [Syntrophobacteraceae bacterium]
MKHLFVAVLIILSMITITGCAHKQVTQTPEQPQAVTPPAPQAEAPKPVVEQPVAPQVETKPVETELSTNMEDIHFDFDKSDIKADDKPTLKNLYGILSADTMKNVVVEGNCDERGTSEYNLALGDRRANAAKSYLVTLGVPAGRIKTISYGKEKPLCTEHTEACWTKNRRDHFVLTEMK